MSETNLPPVVHDAEHYMLEVQHREQWAAEDREIDSRLESLRAEHGTPPNIVHIMWDDTAFGDVGIPAAAGAGQYNVGMEFGGYNAIFHPGFTAIPGAFRIGGGFGVGNQNMGFVPKQGVLHHFDIETLMTGGGLAVDVTVTGEGTDNLMHSFTYSFVDASPNLGSGQFGFRRSGPGGAANDGLFDNLQATVIPEPTTLLIWSLLAGLGVGLGWRRRK